MGVAVDRTAAKWTSALYALSGRRDIGIYGRLSAPTHPKPVPQTRPSQTARSSIPQHGIPLVRAGS